MKNVLDSTDQVGYKTATPAFKINLENGNASQNGRENKHQICYSQKHAQWCSKTLVVVDTVTGTGIDGEFIEPRPRAPRTHSGDIINSSEQATRRRRCFGIPISRRTSQSPSGICCAFVFWYPILLFYGCLLLL